MHPHRLTAAPLAALLALLCVCVPACSKETRSRLVGTGRSAERDSESVARQGEALAAAVALRFALDAGNAKDHTDVRSMTNINHALRTYASKLPGHPRASGVIDANHDGRDDDGKVQIRVGDKLACVVLPGAVASSSVHSGAC